MSFTLSIKNAPWGSVIWDACYGPPPAAEICSPLLGLSEVWNCPYNPYGATDLRIGVYDSNWNVKHSGTNLGPIYDGKDYIYDCSSGVLSEIIPESEFRNISIDSIEPTEVEVGDTVRITARVEHRGAGQTATIYAAIGIQGVWFDEILYGERGWSFAQSSGWEDYYPRVDIDITSAIPSGVYDAYVKVKAPLLVSPTVRDCITVVAVPTEPEFKGFAIEEYVKR